jgi:hypothetical protein
MGPSTPSVDYYIHSSGVIVDSRIIILDKIKPSSLPKARVRLREDILQTLMVRIKFVSLFRKVLSSNLESMNHND